MSRIRGAALAALASVLLCAWQAAAQGAGAGPVDAAAEMRARHQNLFHNLTPERFESAVRDLDARIPTLARHQIIVELARIAATVGDGHTNVYPTRGQRPRAQGRARIRAAQVARRDSVGSADEGWRRGGRQSLQRVSRRAHQQVR